MNEVYNLIKLENFKEYLNQRGVSPKILINPRIYEILDMISDELNVINFGKETRDILDRYLKIDENGNLSYKKDLKTVKLRIAKHQFEFIEECFYEESSSLRREKRCFDNEGVEQLYVIQEGHIEKKEFENNILSIPMRKISYCRDENIFNFVIKEENNGKYITIKYLIQQVPFMLQNLKMTKKDFPTQLNKSSIDDTCEIVARSQAEYDMVKRFFEEGNGESESEIFKTYCNYNRLYSRPKIYEKAIAKKLKTNFEKLK